MTFSFTNRISFECFQASLWAAMSRLSVEPYVAAGDCGRWKTDVGNAAIGENFLTEAGVVRGRLDSLARAEERTQTRFWYHHC
jgi:hypothetical protein